MAGRPAFDRRLLAATRELVADGGLMTNAIQKTAQLNRLKAELEAPSFAYASGEERGIGTECLLALWMACLRGARETSLLGLQQLCYQLVGALMRREEFRHEALGLDLDDVVSAFQKNAVRKGELFHRLLRDTFHHATELVPRVFAGGEEPSHTQRLQQAFCVDTLVLAFFCLPVLQGPVVDALHWKLVNWEGCLGSSSGPSDGEAGAGAGPSDGEADGEAETKADPAAEADETKADPEPADAAAEADGEAETDQEHGPRTTLLHLRNSLRRAQGDNSEFVASNPSLFNWGLLATRVRADAVAPEDNSWLLELLSNAAVFTRFVTALTEHVRRMAAGGDVAWVMVPGYGLMCDLFCALLHQSACDAMRAHGSAVPPPLAAWDAAPRLFAAGRADDFAACCDAMVRLLAANGYLAEPFANAVERICLGDAGDTASLTLGLDLVSQVLERLPGDALAGLLRLEQLVGALDVALAAPDLPPGVARAALRVATQVMRVGRPKWRQAVFEALARGAFDELFMHADATVRQQFAHLLARHALRSPRAELQELLRDEDVLGRFSPAGVPSEVESESESESLLPPPAPPAAADVVSAESDDALVDRVIATQLGLFIGALMEPGAPEAAEAALRGYAGALRG